MTDGARCSTLTYYGAEKVMPHYNVMGVAKAALEASLRYLAVDLGGSRIVSTRSRPVRSRPWRIRHRRLPIYLEVERINSPLKRTVTVEEVGDSALYSCPIYRAALPARCITSIQAIMSSA